MERELSVAFSDSLQGDFVDCVGKLAEVGLDNIMDDGILKEIPFFSTAISIYKIGSSIKDRYDLKKLAVFLDEINRGIVSEEKRKKYQEKIREKDKYKNQQIEYLLVLIERYVSYDKPRLLAKLYLGYLDGQITWNEMAMYAEVIDRFILLDYETLVNSENEVTVYEEFGNDSIQRLIALGLMIETTDKSPFKEHGGNIGLSMESLVHSQSKERTYMRTTFGEKLVSILKCEFLEI